VTGGDPLAALEAALALGADGWFCFPCLEDKRPATPHGFKDAKSDLRGLRDLWRQNPAPLVGVATGAASSVDALDIDCKHLEAREWWAANRDRLPQTRSHRTRSGGLHMLFRHAVGFAFERRQNCPWHRYAGRRWLHHLVAGRRVAGVGGYGAGAMASMAAGSTADATRDASRRASGHDSRRPNARPAGTRRRGRTRRSAE